jgi:hypothetical protein
MFTSDQRKGIFYCFYRCTASRIFFVDVNLTQTVSPKKQEWLAMQSKIDSIKGLNQNTLSKYTHSIPILLLITKATRMSVQEIDRLVKYRKGNKYVNSPRISSSYTSFDSLLNVITPYFKFPDWVKIRHQILGM